MGIATISKIVDKVIWETLHDECIPSNTPDLWQNIANGVLQKTNFPNCIGAIDGKHIRIVNPPGGGSICYNYKHFYFIVLLAMCDADYRFTYVKIGSYGKNSDSTIFQNSTLYRSLEQNTFYIPGPKPLPGTNTPVEHVINCG